MASKYREYRLSPLKRTPGERYEITTDDDWSNDDTVQRRTDRGDWTEDGDDEDDERGRSYSPERNSLRRKEERRSGGDVRYSLTPRYYRDPPSVRYKQRAALRYGLLPRYLDEKSSSTSRRHEASPRRRLESGDRMSLDADQTRSRYGPSTSRYAGIGRRYGYRYSSYGVDETSGDDEELKARYDARETEKRLKENHNRAARAGSKRSSLDKRYDRSVLSKASKLIADNRAALDAESRRQRTISSNNAATAIDASKPLSQTTVTTLSGGDVNESSRANYGSIELDDITSVDDSIIMQRQAKEIVLEKPPVVETPRRYYYSNVARSAANSALSSSASFIASRRPLFADFAANIRAIILLVAMFAWLFYTFASGGQSPCISCFLPETNVPSF